MSLTIHIQDSMVLGAEPVNWTMFCQNLSRRAKFGVIFWKLLLLQDRRRQKLSTKATFTRGLSSFQDTEPGLRPKLSPIESNYVITVHI